MATLKDVAAELGLSPSTVSRGLSGHSHVNEATRASILRTAARLGYQPNAIASALRKRSTRTIGLVVPSIVNDFFALSATSIQRAAEQSGYQVMLCVTDEDPDREEQYLEMLQAHKVAGIVHVPCTERSAERIGDTIPVVEVGRRSVGRRYDSVCAADRDGAEELTRHLIEMGHERIAIISGSPQVSPVRDRTDGYRTALLGAGLPVVDEYIKVKVPSKEWGQRAMSELLALDAPPTAVFAGGAQLALGIFESLQEAGLDCPEDMSVVAFEDPPWFGVWKPGITAYSAPMGEIGFVAWQLLLARINGETTNETDVTESRLSGVLHVRGSTRRLRAAAP
jgi:LacI family transcriptional regulator